MRHHLNDLASMLRTAVGRHQIVRAIQHRCLPFLTRLAMLHRRTCGANARTIAVVGTYGKTTTTRATITSLDLPLPSQGSPNGLSGVSIAMLGIRPWQRYAVIEAGIDNVGQMAVFARIMRPNIAIVTSIGSEHNRSLKSLEVTREEKARMIAALPKDGLAVLNGDDPHVLWMKTRTQARVVTFGFDDGNDVRATDMELDWPEGTRFQLHISGKTYPAAMKLIGRHMMYPILAATAVAHAEGRMPEHVLASLGRLPPTPQRMQPIALQNGVWLLNDAFKSSLETIHAALDVFARIPASRKLVVMGEVSEPPGSQGPIYREIGARVAGMAVKAFFLADNFQAYAAGARRAGMNSSNIVKVGHSVRKAAEMVRDEARPGDVILIKGRDTQRLERIALILQGQMVQCDIDICYVKGRPCKKCPMLETGWGTKRVLT